MLINRVSRLRDYAVFRDFTWPAELSDFGRYNLIYGWNGSGKTMLSRLFHALERRTRPLMGEATVRIDQADIKGDDFPQVTLPVRVFNRDFVIESVFPAGGGEVPPIFVVGKESVEKQKEADRLRAKRTAAEASFVTARAKRQESERALDRFCQDKARMIKDALRSPGVNVYNNYDKSDFLSRAQKMAAEGDVGTHRLTDDDRGSLLMQIRSTPKPKVQEVTYCLPALQQLADGAARLLSTTVVSATIQRLKDDPELAEWIRQGLGLYRDRTSDMCLFCEQRLPPGRLATLEAHFSAEYEGLLRNLDGQIEQLEIASESSSGLILPKRAELYDDLGQEYTDAEQALLKTTETVRECLDGLIRVLTEKKVRPFDCLSLDLRAPALPTDVDVVNRLNAIIRKHNRACDEFQNRIANARDRLAHDMVAQELDEFAQLRKTAQETEIVVSTGQQEIQRFTQEIERLEREIREHRRPAEELNENLRKYLGHGELQLAVKDTGYSITRNGEPAQMLSEGEMTAIALLYFLKALDDRGFELHKGIVVLDDPVSSLDQTALFGAFGYIRARMQSAGQVVILTHNFMFFRLIREWFGHLRGPDKKAWQAYMLECSHDGTCRMAKIRAIDPLLMEFDSEYHYLFSLLYRMATDPPAATLEPYYFAPSVARRVIETFVAFRVPNIGGHNRLWSQMQTIDFEDAKKSRIYRYLQTHSHRDAVGEADEDLALLGESRAVLNDMLDFMRAADPVHVSRMIARVSTPSAAPPPGAS